MSSMHIIQDNVNCRKIGHVGQSESDDIFVSEVKAMELMIRGDSQIEYFLRKALKTFL